MAETLPALPVDLSDLAARAAECFVESGPVGHHLVDHFGRELF